MEFLYDLPLWLSGFLIVGALVAASLVGLRATRRWLIPRFRFGHEHGHFGGAMVGSIMVLYGLVAALISVDVVGTHGEVARAVSLEASRIAAVYRDANGYPEPARSQLQGAIRDYLRHVIDKAWPMQQRGLTPPEGAETLAKVQAVLLTFEPATEGQRILHAEALRAYNTMVEARRERVDAVLDRLPGVLWAVILIGAAISIYGSYFFQMDDEGLHGLFVSLLSILIGLIIFMTFAMDHPYRGQLGVDSKPYELIYDQLMK
jgi:hypothetical protein